jgi:Prp8 binding protein
VITTSADKTVAVWDIATARAVRRIRGHDSFVNAVSAAADVHNTFATVCDDGLLRVRFQDRSASSFFSCACHVDSPSDNASQLWDSRAAESCAEVPHKFQQLSCALSRDAIHAYSAGIDGVVRRYDMRRGEADMTLSAHVDTITGIALSADGGCLLSNGMDNTVRLWDVRPFVSGGDEARCTRTMVGHKHNYERLVLRCSFSPDARHCSAGSSDQAVCIWECAGATMVSRLGGHSGTVTQVAFHPRMHAVASSSTDHTVIVGSVEL